MNSSVLVRLAAVSLCLLNGCSAPQSDPSEQKAPLIILVSVDQLRPDLVSAFGGGVPTPELEALVTSGSATSDAATVCPMTRPAVSSLLTGLSPDRTDVRDDLVDRLPADATTIAEQLGTAGWRTAAFVNTKIVARGSGLDRGFRLFDGPDDSLVGPGAYYPPVHPSTDTVSHLGQWIEARTDGAPSFAWVHLADLRGAVIDAERGAEATATTYAEAVSGLDRALGSIAEIARTAARDRVVDLFVVGTSGILLETSGVADGARGASYWLIPETLRVPLVWARFGPAGDEPQRIAPGPRSILDVHPTIRAIAGLPRGISGDGIALSLPIGEGVRVRRAWTWAPHDEQLWPTLTAVEYHGAWYSFDSDRLTTVDDQGDEVKKIAAERPARPRTAVLTGETRTALRAAGIPLGDSNVEVARPANEDAAELATQVFRLRYRFATDQRMAIRRNSGRMMIRFQHSLSVPLYRGIVMLNFGDPVSAEPLFTDLLLKYPDRRDVLHWAGHLELQMERRERARLLLEAATELGSADGDLLYDLACLDALDGDRASALVRLREAIDAGFRNWSWIEIDPDLASIRSDPEYGRVMSEYGQ